MKLKFKSIRFKISVWVIGLLLLSLFLTSSVIFMNTQAIYRDNIADNALNSARANAQAIENWLRGIQEELSSLAMTEEIRSMDWERQFPLLSPVRQRHGEKYEMLFVVDQSGYARTTTPGLSVDLSSRDYVQQIFRDHKPRITNPLISATTGKMITVIAVPILDNRSQILGILAASVELTYLENLVRNATINHHGNGWIIDDQMVTIAHTDRQYLGNKKLLEEGGTSLTRVAQRMVRGESDFATYELHGEEKVIGFYPISLTGWSIGVLAEADEVYEGLHQIRTLTTYAVLGTLLIGLILASIISYVVIRPIKKATVMLKDIAQGESDLTQRLEVETQDEMGEMAQWFNLFIQRIQETIGEIALTAADVRGAGESLSSTSEQAGQVTQQVAVAIGQVAAGVSDQVRSMGDASKAMDELVRVIAEIDRASGEQLEIVGAASERMKSLSQAIGEAGSTTTMVNESVTQVVEMAQTGSRSISATTQGMESINQSSKEVARHIQSLGEKSEAIGGIIQVIEAISDQTNLLALNAAIEAARAGEHGRGFAVVADEVRKLAERSSQSTREIGGLIKSIQEDIKGSVQAIEGMAKGIRQGTQLANESNSSFTGILVEMEKTTKKMERLLEASQTVLENNEQIRGSIQEIVNVAQQNRASTITMAKQSDLVRDSIVTVTSVSEETAASAEEVSASAEEQAAGIEEMSAASEQLAQNAKHLHDLIHLFKV